MSGTSKLASIVVALGVAYAFVYPSLNDLSVLRAEEQKYEEAITTVQNIENRKNELLTQFNQVSATDRKKIETLLPDSLDFVRLTSDIDAIGSKYGIAIDKVSAIGHDTSSGTSIESAAPAKPYQSAVVGFSFVASYDTFVKFLNDLERSLRILDIHSIHLTPQAAGLYMYTVEFETYWFK